MKGARPASKSKSRKSARSSPTSGPVPWISYAAILAAGLAAYSNSFTGVFVLDDIGTIVENPGIRSFEECWNADSDDIPRGLHRRPVVRWSLAVNYAGGELETWGYHAWNLLVHLISALLLFDLVRRTLLLKEIPDRLQQSATGVATAVALLWIAHPLQTESVTYVIQRLEAMMGMFYLGCLYCVLRGSQSERGWCWNLGAIACCWLGMGSKEVMITAPLVVLLFDRIFLSPSWAALLRKRWWMYVSFLPAAIMLLSAASTRLLSKEMLDRAPNPLVPDRWSYLLSQPGVILHYLRLCFWPQGQCLDYGWQAAKWPGEILLPGIVVLSMLAVSFYVLWRWPRIGFLAVSFFLILAPTSSIIRLQLAFEHRMYLPLAAVCILVVLGVFSLPERFNQSAERMDAWRRFAFGAAVMASIAIAMMTCQRNTAYESRITMWEDVISKSPNNPRARVNLGLQYYEQQKYKIAAQHYEVAVRIHPNNADAHNNYANSLYRIGNRQKEAMEHWRKAIELSPNLREPYNNLGNAFFDLGETKTAIANFEKAIDLSPNYTAAHYNLGNAYFKIKRLDDSVKHLQIAVHLDPTLWNAHQDLGATLMDQGREKEGIRHLEKAVQLGPKNPAMRRNIAEWHAKQGDKFVKQQRWKEARKAFSDAVRVDPNWGPPQQMLRKLPQP